jgi:hypothetical protein
MPPRAIAEGFFDIHQVCERSALNPSSVYRHIRQGQISAAHAYRVAARRLA